MFGNQIRFAGMTSGMDTHTIVQQLMRAESMRMDRLSRRRQLATWRQEQFRNISNEMRRFQDSHLTWRPGNVMAASTFSTMQATVSQGGVVSNALTVTSGANAQAGQFVVVVQEVATTARVVGRNINDGRSADPDAPNARITGATRIDSDVFRYGSPGFNMPLAHSIVTGTPHLSRYEHIPNPAYPVHGPANIPDPNHPPYIEFPIGSGTYILNPEPAPEIPNPDYVPGTPVYINNPAYVGNFGYRPVDDNPWRIPVDANGNILTTSVTTPATVTFLDTDWLPTGTSLTQPVQTHTDAHGTVHYFVRLRNPDYPGVTDAPRYNYWAVDRIAGATEANDAMELRRGGPGGDDLVDLSGSTIAGASRAFANNVTHTQVFESTITINGQPITIRSNYTVQNVVSAINASDAGVVANFDAVNGIFTLASRTVGSEGYVQVNADPTGLLAQLMGGPTSTDITQGTNAEVYADNIRLTSLNDRQDSFSFNGHTIMLSGAVAGQTFHVTAHRDIDNAVNAVRDFVNQYNDLIRLLHSSHSTARPRVTSGGTRSFFEPLTDAERREMSDREVERWEEQSQRGLLHRDSTLRNLHNQLRMQMNTGVYVGIDNGISNNNLLFMHNLGITTIGRNPDDPNQSNIGLLHLDEDALRAAIQRNPEAVSNFFNRHPEAGLTADYIAEIGPAGLRTRMQTYGGMAHRLNDIVTAATHLTTGSLTRIAGNETGIVQDRFTRQIQQYDRRIDRMQEWLVRRENQLFRQFSMMEQAMSRSHQQMDMLFMFGMN